MNRLCLVTNATARSICWYIIVYLKNRNLSDERILEIKSKLGFKDDLNTSIFSLDEIVKSFTEKNIYFIRLFSFLKEENRYLRFLEKLDSEHRAFHFFPEFNDIKIIYDDFYNRNVFHTSIFCKWMKNDFISHDRIEKNTGVFANEILHRKSNYYKIDEEYLSQLQLRECKICQDILSKSLNQLLYNFQMVGLINKAEKNISITYDLIQDKVIYSILLLKAKTIPVEIYLKESEWKNCDVNVLTKQKFNVRLIHDNFSFFNSNSIITIDETVYFHLEGSFYIPNKEYVDTTAFKILKNNTIALSDNIEINAGFADYVPVTYLHESRDDENGYQTIVEISSYGLSAFITLNCDQSVVPDSIYGFWQSKAIVFLDISKEDNKHNYFDFKCIDPNVIKYL